MREVTGIGVLKGTMNVMELPSLLIIPREECTNSIVQTMDGR